MIFKVGNFSAGGNDVKRAAIEAAKQRATPTSEQPQSAMLKWLSPADVTDRIRIVFDDSYSMNSQIPNAKRGVVEFFKNCIPNQTACAVHFMNARESLYAELQTNLPKLSMDIEEASLQGGNTPFFNTIMRALKAKPTLTRLVAFTDGAPTDSLQGEEDESAMAGYYSFNNQQSWISSADVVIKNAQMIGGEKCIPIDTIYFGRADQFTQKQRDLLKYLSDRTGGFFMVFDPAKVNFRTAFKYLAPVNRLMLTSGTFRASLEAGDIK